MRWVRVHRRRGGRLLRGLLALLACGAASAAELPPEDQCPLVTGLPGQPAGEDAAARRLRSGMLLAYEDVLVLRSLLPDEIWQHREQFFHDGMRMLIGPCHRRYPTLSFYREATERFGGVAKLDDEGNLSGYVAGTPFPPNDIDPRAPDAGARWAWNVEHRFRGAAHEGPFRVVDLPSTKGSIQTFSGDFFFIQTRHRADLPESGYAVPDTPDALWIAGGRFKEPFRARHLAWRQERPEEISSRYEEPDDTFVYIPTARKSRRSATAWVDGMFMPRYRVSGDQAGAGLFVGNPMGGAGGGELNPGSAASNQASEHIRRGFVGMALRPNAYVWRYEGEREILAPLNGAHKDEPNRNFGPSGLSVGADRWDVRYAVVLQGIARESNGPFQTLKLYVDYQTQQPLFLVTRRSRGTYVDVGVLVYRFSGDIPGYPLWPNGEKAMVFDPVLASFYSAQDGSGWRRESYRMISTPLSASKLRRYTTSSYLAAGR